MTAKIIVAAFTLAIAALLVTARPAHAMDAAGCARLFGASVRCPNGGAAQFTWDEREQMCLVECVQPQ